MDRTGSVAALRAAVSTFSRRHIPDEKHWYVALSGGPDSLALTAVAARLRPTVALVVDHGLQTGSAAVAQTAARQAIELGCSDASVLTVEVGRQGGPEAAARAARYAALADASGGASVLLGHTLDDQAETVLLGLGRGSGARSIAGMRPYLAPWCRPLLRVRRTVTHTACEELGLVPWIDPHNVDPAYTRSRLRTDVLPLLEEVLGGGVAEALARTGESLGEDCDTLDAMAQTELRAAVADSDLDVRRLSQLPDALRRRVIRSWLLVGGAVDLTDEQIRRVEDLVMNWHGQGGVAVGSSLRRQRLVAARADGRLRLHREPV
ncbi:MAG: tRNA(Ile)-lysidine synthase [Mycobacterium sp.]|jgi:tRNA(Ile)-lysidine synthase|nr:tRNA(Ile)-lysidine synthase [Mycobacterium sp.]